MKRAHKTIFAFVLLLIFSHALSAVFAQGTAFTYQGQLQNNGSPANGGYDLQFTLYATNCGGAAIAGPVTSFAVLVSNGLFTTTVDFGPGIFIGATNWLDIAVESNGVGPFTELTSRQQLTPVPNAIYAESGGTATALASGTSLGSGSSDAIATGVSDPFIGGGSFNQISGGNYTFVGGGQGNQILGGGDYAFIGGGGNNTASGYIAAIVGGLGNTASGEYATVVGGYGNTASGTGSFIGGGGFDGEFLVGNHNQGDAAFIGGGLGNVIQANEYYGSADYAVISGGDENTAGAPSATVGGGSYNGAAGAYTTVSGGDNNKASNIAATVGGGSENQVSGGYSTVGGGTQNTASNDYATVAGGLGNTASGVAAALGGGDENHASGNSATLGGGSGNTASGYVSTVPGGQNNIASGNASLAVGDRAGATNDNSFVWSDGSTNTVSTGTNQFVARASGGFVFYSDSGSDGVCLWPGSGTWSMMSDRNAKNQFAPVNAETVLASVAALPMTTWSYKAEHGVRHIGPMAQDFYAAFKVGADDRHITEVDEGGVALAAVQGLNQKLESDNAELKRENNLLGKRLDELEAEVKTLERNSH